MAHIIDHLSVAELGRRARTWDDACAARHYQAIWMLAQGKPLCEVAATTGFVQRWLEQLASRYNQFGPEALGDRRRRNGTRAAPDPRLAGQAAGRLAEPPPDGGTWKTAKIAAWMAADLGVVSVYPQRAWEALQAIGWSIQAPRPKNPAAAGADEQAAFKKKLADALAEEEARHPGRPVALFCTDEHRTGLKPITRRVWAPRGQRPIARGHHRYQWLTVTAFVAPATGESH